jgi:hypothetical protein
MKKRIALFYGTDGAAAKLHASRINDAENRVTLMEAAAFVPERFEHDEVRFMDDVDDRMKDIISRHFGDRANVADVELTAEPINIPDDWENMKAQEMMALASRIDETATVRNKADASAIIKKALEEE